MIYKLIIYGDQQSFDESLNGHPTGETVFIDTDKLNYDTSVDNIVNALIGAGAVVTISITEDE